MGPKSQIITLTTDFGVRDSYVAQLKGTILEIAPFVTLVDICHEVPSYDIGSGAFILGAAARRFPPGTIHCAVVDPGVGGTRKKLAVLTSSRHLFVAPDNGLLTFALQGMRIQKIVSLENPRYFRTEVSSTFHGRDVFAPVAAYLARGVSVEAMGPRVKQWKRLKEFVVRLGKKRVVGHVIFIDKFGNALTSITRRVWQTALGERFQRLTVGALEVSRLVQTYSQVPKGEPAVLFSSENLLEIASYQDAAARKWGLEVGQEVVIHLK